MKNTNVVILLILSLLIVSCGPIANSANKAINKAINKGGKEVLETSNFAFRKTFNEVKVFNENFIEIDKIVLKNFNDDIELNYFFKIDEKINQINKKDYDLVKNIWDLDIERFPSKYERLYELQPKGKYKNKEEYLNTLPKLELILGYTLLGFVFTFSNNLDAEKRGKGKKISPILKRRILCAQFKNVVSIRTNDYPPVNCVQRPLEIKELKAQIKERQISNKEGLQMEP